MYTVKYTGCPLLKNKLIVFNHSGPPPALKLTKVIGKSKRELANIGGITPAVLIFNGKCEDSATLFPAPGCLLGYCIVILLCALSMKTINAMTEMDIINKNTINRRELV